MGAVTPIEGIQKGHDGQIRSTQSASAKHIHHHLTWIDSNDFMIRRASICIFSSSDAVDVAVVALACFRVRAIGRSVGRADLLLVSGHGELAD